MNEAANVTTYALGLLLGALGGAVGTTVAMRTRLTMMQRDNKDTADRLTRLEEELTSKVASMDRRQLALLRMTADLARKAGTDARWDDVMIRFLADESA